MQLVRGAAVVVVGGALALGAFPAQAACGHGGDGYGRDGQRGDGREVSVVREVTPRSCTQSFSTFAKKEVTECHQGWSVTRKVRQHDVVKVKVRSQATVTATAPGYAFKDVDDVWDKKVYRHGHLVSERKTVRVTYTVQGAPSCVVSTTTVTANGKTRVVDSSNTCPAGLGPAQAAA